MKEEIKEKFPSWCSDNKKYYMCLTDDLDSLFSCILLQKIKGYEISRFYSFNTLYRNKEIRKEKLVGVDMDLQKGRCWGNHVTPIKNFNSANLNTILNINSNNYYTKYCGSVLLQIISFYNIDISNLTDLQKIILLAVDSTFLMYNFNKSNCRRWVIDILQLNPLWDILQRYTQKDFNEVIQEYNLKKKIFVNEDRFLKTGIKLEELSKLFKNYNLSFLLPKNEFVVANTYQDVGVSTYNYKNYIEKNKLEVFSIAQTNKNFIKLSYYKK